MDLFPMLTDEWLDEHPDKRDQDIPEMFCLTLDFIREFKLPIILSCQCFRPFQRERWGSFTHDMVPKLSSSMVSAERQTVFSFHFEEHFIHCVQGFHPAKLYHEDYEREQTLDKILRQIFYSLFEPCAPWQNENLEKSLRRKTESIQILIKQIRQNAAEYDELRIIGHSPGMAQHREGSITAEQWDNPEKALDLIVQLLSPNTSKKL
ncbi:hypothetical protein PENSOL_c021G01060 [Penicillium solitum]|uniref:Uncharacterized protein n=1 Tax=Penicillium solitum TaxID=60172 RepID=A0A1V6R1A3_9EURO|nr:uncharacterized protein PENSOL_c021G01060 [Penicillium solitum]OQD95223.1 hypothetical protein PENSOL_c021G01060 [Penicillium solitum]